MGDTTTSATSQTCIRGNEMYNDDISIMELREVFDYRPDLGGSCLVWKKARGKSKKSLIGKLAGTRHSAGYWQIGMDNKFYLAHRVVWALHTGEWPKFQLDHKNRDRDDTRIENLRLCFNNHSDNMQNLSAFTKSDGLPRGVSKSHNGRYRARIKVKGIEIHIGSFDNMELAYEARLKAQQELWPFQPTPNS